MDDEELERVRTGVSKVTADSPRESPLRSNGFRRGAVVGAALLISQSWIGRSEGLNLPENLPQIFGDFDT